MKLDSYRQKRDASRTNEPVGDEPRGGGGPTWKGAFVVHQHDATRMHYDLRLEVAGVLASFAVPRGPTLDPELRNLAIHTEDHPIEYLDFEAVIPQNTYGAGPMIVWDFGIVRYLDLPAEDGLKEGKLHFSLEGRKLRGRFGLVRVKPRDKPKKGKESREWLLLKKQDGFAKKGCDIVSEQPRSVLSGLTVAELLEATRIAGLVEEEARAIGRTGARVDGRKLVPMLAAPGEAPKGQGWVYELKMDGVRVVATKDERGVELTYRSGRSATAAYPEIARAVAALPPSRLVLDGEVVAFDDKGRPSFERLASRIHASPRADLRLALQEVPVVFTVFDLLSLGEASLLDVPLQKRKELLATLLPAPGVLRVLEHLDADPERLLAFCRQTGIEGIVAKRVDGPYRPGPQRSGDWIKTKCEKEELFVVVGYTFSESNRRRVGALDLATYEGDALVWRGKVGSGLSDFCIDELLALLEPLRCDAPQASGEYEPAPAGRVHVRPEHVVRVKFLEWSEIHHLRHPVFVGRAEGVDPRDCRAAPHDEDHAGVGVEAAPEPEAIDVRTTNRSKVFWPKDGLTKGDLIDYYASIAPTLLPYLADRPVMLVRYPDGIEGKSFYQWNVPHGMPGWLKTVVLGKHVASADEGDQKKHVFLVDRAESLVYIANLACIPVHILASRVRSPAEADFLTIDFDVKLLDLRAAVAQAHTLRAILDEVGLTGFPKTSGQTGLHVFVPLVGGGVSPTAARTLADLLGRILVERHPDTATMERVVQKRGPKVYVDTGQTGPSRTIVAPYSVRATPGARVSTPLAWSEVVPDLDPGAFTMKTVPDRVARVGDPMRALLETRPDMERVMARLGALLGKG